ncbi:MAG: SDR family NAD(P)-dependent oxidoreductase, partial [Bacteriovoracaceae bacterium]|nr:SDR family NAD(P)-dependent oxidoreductase [Bacteriovoracaceae bacterium]
LDPIQDASCEDLEKMIQINVLGMIYVTKAAIPLMQKAPSPHIINLGSIAGKEPYPKGHVYCASKAAVDAFTKGIRQDLLPLGFKVSAIHPGMVNTEFSTVRFHGDKAQADQTYRGLTPLTADDVAEAIMFMINRPAHVNIAEVVIFPKAQANATVSWRQGT